MILRHDSFEIEQLEQEPRSSLRRSFIDCCADRPHTNGSPTLSSRFCNKIGARRRPHQRLGLRPQELRAIRDDAGEIALLLADDGASQIGRGFARMDTYHVAGPILVLVDMLSTAAATYLLLGLSGPKQRGLGSVQNSHWFALPEIGGALRMLSNLISFHGRLGRHDFWIYYISVSVAALALLWLKNAVVRGVLPTSTGLQFMIFVANALSLAIVIPASISLIALTVRRCRDVGINPWLLLIPVLNVLIFLGCMFAPSGWRAPGR